MDEERLRRVLAIADEALTPVAEVCMGSYATCKIGEMTLYSTKNSVHEWFFKKSDRRIVRGGDPSFVYEVPAATLIRRLELSGFTLMQAEKQFDSEKLRRQHELEAHLQEKREEYEEDFAPHMAILKAANFQEWMKKLREIFERKLDKTDEYDESVDYGDGVLNVLLCSPAYQYLNVEEDFAPEWHFLPVNWPCSDMDTFARVLLEVVSSDTRCVLDVTDLIDGGWTDEFEDLIEHEARCTKFFEFFESSIEDIRTLLAAASEQNQTLMRLLYANVITAMEAYLSDTMRKQILSRQPLLRRFVETNPDLRERRIRVSELFKTHEAIKSTVGDLLERTIFHNLEKVIGMYQNVLAVEFPRESIVPLSEAIEKRHHIVHRNGRNVAGDQIQIDRQMVEALVSLVFCTLKNIDEQVQEGLLDEVEFDDQPEAQATGSTLASQPSSTQGTAYLSSPSAPEVAQRR